MRYVWCLFSTMVLSACGHSGSSSSGSGSASGVSGVVSAGPIGGATVTAYTLNANGSQGAQLASTTTDASGKYSLALSAQSGPVIIVASAGSYSEEASGASVAMGSAQIRTVLASTIEGQQVGVTPVTEIATQSTLAAASTNVSADLAAVIKSSNATVAAAMGLNDITIPPANPAQAAASATSKAAAQYAVVLATISQMAKSASSANSTTINSLDMMQALATTFTYNGSFTAAVGATAVPVSNATSTSVTLNSVLGGSSGFSTAMHAAMNTVAATMPAGFSDSTIVPPPSFVTAPPAPMGAPTLALPAPPANLIVMRPTSAGPPSPPPMGSSTASSTTQVLASSIASAAAQSDDGAGASVAMMHNSSSKFALIELLLPQASATTCANTTSSHAQGSVCTGGNMTLVYGSTAANGCTNAAMSASWSGNVNLSFNSPTVCGYANGGGLGALRASGSVNISSPGGVTRSLASGAYVVTDSNTVTPAGFVTQPSGGMTITCSATGAANACATSRSINLLGLHRAEYNAAQEKVFDHTLSTLTPLTISGTGANKIISAGVMVLQHNLAMFQATSTIATPLTFSAACCWPTGGSVTTSYSNGKTGSETLTFGSCGTASVINGSTTTPIHFTHCM